jgi:hypothetical protein
VQHHREAIELPLDHKPGRRNALVQPGDPLIPCAHVIHREGVGQAEDCRRVSHLGEPFCRLTSNAAGGRIGRHQFGMRRFQREKLAHQQVVLRVADQRRGEDMVAVVVEAYLLAKLLCPLRPIRRSASHPTLSLSRRAAP